jgi:hypothetical protein
VKKNKLPDSSFEDEELYCPESPIWRIYFSIYRLSNEVKVRSF